MGRFFGEKKKLNQLENKYHQQRKTATNNKKDCSYRCTQLHYRNDYTPKMDGQTVIYGKLFAETRALLFAKKGQPKRNWFANTRAAYNSKGRWFANTRAFLSGKRPWFAAWRLHRKPDQFMKAKKYAHFCQDDAFTAKNKPYAKFS